MLDFTTNACLLKPCCSFKSTFVGKIIKGTLSSPDDVHPVIALICMTVALVKELGDRQRDRKIMNKQMDRNIEYMQLAREVKCEMLR